MLKRAGGMAILLIMTGCIACAQAASSIVGTWELVSMQKQDEQSQWRSRCHVPTGLLTYTAQGYMAVGINCMKKDSGVPDFDDTIFYTGTYSQHAQRVTHHIRNAANPEFFGKDLQRSFVLETPDRLIINGKGKSGAAVRLIWKRLGSITH